MNGIAGIVYPDVFQMGDSISPMLESMKHRGGNTGGEPYTYKNIQVGVCSGKPAANPAGTIFAGFDGHITNADDLRRELLSQGCRFNGQDHSELILNGYAHWDISLFEKIRGEFAIFILDQRKDKLILCRDRIGVKPLYWHHNARYFIFASELKGILAAEKAPLSPALDSLSSYLSLGYIPQDMTPINGVNKLLPSYYIEFYLDGTKTINSYWSYSSFFDRQSRPPLNTIVEELSALVKENIQASLNPAETIGCVLSKELDSTCTAYFASQIVPKQNLIAYTPFFEGENEEDLPFAEQAAHLLGLKQKSFAITSDNFLDELVKMCWYLDEPLADPQIVSVWQTASAASKEAKTLITGIGREEVFGWHSHYSMEEEKKRPAFSWTQSLVEMSQKILIDFFKLIYKPYAFTLLRRSETNPMLYNYLKHNFLMDEHEINAASPRLTKIFDPKILLHKFYGLNRIQSPSASCLYLDMKTCIPDHYLIKFERCAAAHSLKWKVPFFDSKIVEYMATLTEPAYLRERGLESYLQALMKEFSPDSFLKRQHKPHKPLLRTWIEKDKMKDIFKLLLKGNLTEYGLISISWLREKIEKLHLEPCAYKHLWAILILEIWFKLYINKTNMPYPPEVGVKEFLEEQA